jgi:hypothetical protein
LGEAGIFHKAVSVETIYCRMVRWLKNWNRSGRKRWLSGRLTIPEFAWRKWRKPRTSGCW